ncbi:hypothetical protein ERN12_16410 [Rhodobacteraceae bacterium]|nr:hypothetical protein ERN12_16410 [Paracoccaceae bacterium]
MQKFFSESKDFIGSAGVEYPIVDDDFKQRYLKSFLRPKGKEFRDIQPSQKRSLDRLLLNVRESSAENIFLSCEELTNEQDFSLSAGDLKGLADYIKGMRREVKILVYLREPAAYYLSRMQESIKSQPGIILPSEFDAKLLWVVEQYEIAFGVKADVRAFVRENLVSGDIVTDVLDFVCSGVGPSSLSVPSKPTNESLSGEVMFALDVLRRYPAQAGRSVQSGNTGIRQLWRLLDRFDRQIGPPSKPKLYAQAAQQVSEAASQDLIILKNRYGVEFPAYAPLYDVEAPAVDDRISDVEGIVPVDRSRAFALMGMVVDHGIRVAMEAKK